MTGIQIYKRVTRNLILLVSMWLILPVTIKAQNELPDTPKMTRVSWEHGTDAVRLEWEASEDPTVDLYILYIYVEQNNAWDDIYTFGSETFSYDITNDTYKGQTYVVTAMDTLNGSDDRESLLGENPHKAIEVSLEFDPCAPSNTINWSGYVGWEGNTSGYKIYGGLKGDSMEMLTFVHPKTRTFTHQGVSLDTIYNYYVEAVNTSGITSLSPIEEIQTDFPDAPALLRVDEVSVISNNSVELRFTADVSGPVNSFRIMRRSNRNDPYTEVTSIWNSNISNMDYVDRVETDKDVYEYLVEAVYMPETCAQAIKVSESSNIGTNILLTSESPDKVAQLTWTPYQSYSTGLSGYSIQRKSGDGEFIETATVGAGANSWQEPIESVINGYQPGEVQYKVLALSNQVEGNDPGISVSNIVSVFVETEMQVPNAFTPGRATNYLFKPVIDFAPSKYKMIIYDRGGRTLFETSDPTQGWDGTFKGGDFAMEGVYVYFIQYTDYTGPTINLKGNVTVIYPPGY